MALLLACMLIFTLAACGEKESNGKASNKPYIDAVEAVFKYLSGKPMSESDIRRMHPEGLLSINSYMDSVALHTKETQTKLSKVFGDDYEASYKITSDKKISDNDFKQLVADWADLGFSDANKITEAYEVTWDITFKGSKDEQTFKVTEYVMEYNGTWYMLNAYADGFDEYID